VCSSSKELVKSEVGSPLSEPQNEGFVGLIHGRLIGESQPQVAQLLGTLLRLDQGTGAVDADNTDVLMY
jgi:hypothetical protein